VGFIDLAIGAERKGGRREGRAEALITGEEQKRKGITQRM